MDALAVTLLILAGLVGLGALVVGVLIRVLGIFLFGVLVMIYLIW